MTRRIRGSLIACVPIVCIGVVALGAQGKPGGNPEALKLKNPVPATAESVAAGQVIYKRRCGACHGADGKGGPPKEDYLKAPPNLIDGSWDHGSSDGEIYWVIKNGVPPDLLMEGWDDRLSETDMWNVVNFLRDLAQKNK